MKELNDFLYESLLNDEDRVVNEDNGIIDDFLNKNYEIWGKYTIHNGVVDVDGDAVLRNKNLNTLTEGLFEFGKIKGIFECPGCRKLKNLKGGPEEVGAMNCCCNNLSSLEGAPQRVEDQFNCSENSQLRNLEGSPKYVGGNFDCCECESLTSLKGCPEEVGGDFDLSDCYNLSDFNSLPKKIKGLFKVSVKVDKRDIKQRTKARRVIS